MVVGVVITLSRLLIAVSMKLVLFGRMDILSHATSLVMLIVLLVTGVPGRVVLSLVPPILRVFSLVFVLVLEQSPLLTSTTVFNVPQPSNRNGVQPIVAQLI
jgi:hypothetical protein